MESAFSIIAEPNRRAIVSLLAASERSVGDIEEELQLPQPSVSKHGSRSSVGSGPLT
jgi:DNA-binding transcriptional ArsR family regulator